MIERVRPRPSKSKSVLINVAKTLAQIIVFWSAFLLVAPLAIHFGERHFGLPSFAPQPFAGWVLFALMGTIGIYSGMLFAVRGGGTPLPADTTTRFLVLGPYRWVRNPMAMTGTLQGVAVGLILGSPLTIAYSVAGMFLWHWVARPWEEADLARRFGEPYLRYQAKVRCWIPSLRPYPPEVDVERSLGR